MAYDKRREDALSGTGLLLYAQMEGGVYSIFDHLGVFCKRIEQYGLKPWSSKGRERLNEGISELIKSGAYDSLTLCERCRDKFPLELSVSTVDLFLQYWRDEIEYDDFMLCRGCGGEIEKSGDNNPISG